MRVGFLLVALGVAVWAMPPVELPKTDVIEVSVLSDRPSATPASWSAPRTLANVGGDTFVYAVPPKTQGGPILPDYPWPLPDTAPDAAPGAMLAPLDLGQILAEPVSARLPGSKKNPNFRRVTANSLNMRSGPAKRFSTITSLQAGAVAEVTGRSQSGWVPIKLVDTGQSGWVFHRFLAPIRG